MAKAVKKGQIIVVTVLCVLCFSLVVEGKPQLYSCTLTITNGSNLHNEYTCNHDFDISEDGAKIPNNGVTGYLTADVGCACKDVEPPHNNSGWAAVVKYGNFGDCNIDYKVYSVMAAGYLMVLLVSSQDCNLVDVNTTYPDYDTFTIPIIMADYPLSAELLKYSVPTNEIDYAAEVTVEAVYVDFALLWTVFGVTVAITITSTVCCFCIFFVFRGLASKFRRQGLSRWSLRKLPQRKYVKGKETYETCAICLEEFENADMIRVLPCSHIYHSKCVDEWLMKWNRVCPVCKRVILRNERNGDQVEAEEDEPTLPESQSSPTASSADNISDSRTVESIPLLVTLHESTEGRTHRYGSTAESSTDGPSGQYLLESFASMQNNNNSTLSQQSEESTESNDSLPTAESDHTVTV